MNELKKYILAKVDERIKKESDLASKLDMIILKVKVQSNLR